jgi:uncharacterized protein YceK
MAKGKKMKKMFALIAVAVLTQVAGCAQMLGYETPTEGPYEYRLGYYEGCKSGRASANYGKMVKNVDLYRDNADYKIGWDDAYAHCNQNARNLNRELGF